MVSRQNEIYSILGISWGEQSSPASPAVRTRQEEIFDILSLPSVSYQPTGNDPWAALEKGAPLGGAGTRSVTEGGTSAISASAQPPYRLTSFGTSPSRGRLPGDQSGSEVAAQGGGLQKGSPTGGAGVSPYTETKPMGSGGGGFSGGGGGRDGRADQIQQDLDDAESRLKTLKIDYAYAETPEQIFNYGRQIEEEQARIKELKSKLEMLRTSKK